MQTGTEAILNTKSTGYTDNKGIILNNENWITYTIEFIRLYIFNDIPDIYQMTPQYVFLIHPDPL